MKVKELMIHLSTRHPDAQVEVYFHNALGSDSRVLEAMESDYALFTITGVGDWGNPGESDDLVTINAGKLMGC